MGRPSFQIIRRPLIIHTPSTHHNSNDAEHIDELLFQPLFTFSKKTSGNVWRRGVARMDADIRSDTKTRRFKRKREAILGAAAALINHQGLRETSMQDVARKVGLSASSVTYYYRRKEDLAAACFQETINSLRETATRAALGTNAEARITSFLSSVLETIARIEKGEQEALVNFHDLRAYNGPTGEDLREQYSDIFRLVRNLLHTPDMSQLPRAELNARAHLYFSITLWASSWILYYDTDDYERVSSRLADLILNGICVKQGAWAPVALTGRIDTPSPEHGFPESYLRAATRLFNEFGYQGTSVDQISAELNLTKGSFYHHIDTKEDLIAACCERSFSVVRRIQDAAMELPADGWTRLTSAAASLMRYQFSEDGRLLRYTALVSVREDRRIGLQMKMDRLIERFASMIVDGIADGSIRAVDPTIAANAINAAINAAAELHSWSAGISADEAVDSYARIAFEGIFAP